MVAAYAKDHEAQRSKPGSSPSAGFLGVPNGTPAVLSRLASRDCERRSQGKPISGCVVHYEGAAQLAFESAFAAGIRTRLTRLARWAISATAALPSSSGRI